MENTSSPDFVKVREWIIDNLCDVDMGSIWLGIPESDKADFIADTLEEISGEEPENPELFTAESVRWALDDIARDDVE